MSLNKAPSFLLLVSFFLSNSLWAALEREPEPSWRFSEMALTGQKITEDEWMVSIVRFYGNQHAFLVIEGVDIERKRKDSENKKYLYVTTFLDFVGGSAKNFSGSDGKKKVRICRYIGKSDLIFRCDKHLMNLYKYKGISKGELFNLVCKKNFRITRLEAKSIVKEAEKDENRIKSGELDFHIAGKGSPLSSFFKNNGCNCFTWAKAKIENNTDYKINFDFHGLLSPAVNFSIDKFVAKATKNYLRPKSVLKIICDEVNPLYLQFRDEQQLSSCVKFAKCVKKVGPVAPLLAPFLEVFFGPLVAPMALLSPFLINPEIVVGVVEEIVKNFNNEPPTKIEEKQETLSSFFKAVSGGNIAVMNELMEKEGLWILCSKNEDGMMAFDLAKNNKNLAVNESLIDHFNSEINKRIQSTQSHPLPIRK